VDSRGIRVVLEEGWAPPRAKGLLDADHRVRTLLKILLSYPEVRHVRPTEVSLDPGVEPKLLETIGKFLGRQGWLVKRVELI
jgi:hypothetical protein